MQFRESFQVAAPPALVREWLAEPAFAQLRAHTEEAIASRGTVNHTGEGAFTVTLQRVFPASMVPSVFRAFVPARLEVIQTERWNGNIAALQVHVTGVPVQAAGHVQLTGDHTSSHLDISGVLRANLPFIGRTVEQQVVGMLGDFAAHEARAAATWLERMQPNPPVDPSKQ